MAPGISVFFPAYNDSATIASLVMTALDACAELTDNYEVIVVNDGSTDATAEVADKLAKSYPQVRVIHHPQNRGYGGALRSGFAAATKEFVFYTDGDAQYDPRELRLLWQVMAPGIDIVNGYKISRSDPIHRIIIGRVYRRLMRITFRLPIYDIDCDFRLIRRHVFDKMTLTSTSGTICVEFIKKAALAGFTFAEVPVHHYHRQHGRSQFFNFRRLWRTFIQLCQLWWDLRQVRKAAPPSDGVVSRGPGLEGK